VIGLTRSGGSERSPIPVSRSCGSDRDPATVEQASRRVEAIIHLAWSFSDDPESCGTGSPGHALLLRQLRGRGGPLHYTARRWFYGSRPVSRGRGPPLERSGARKPAYGPKEFAEKLVLLAGQAGMSSTDRAVLWAFGTTSAARTCGRCCETSARANPLAVPADCGGSFLSRTTSTWRSRRFFSVRRRGRQVFKPRQRLCDLGRRARNVVQVTGGRGGNDLVRATRGPRRFPRRSLGVGRPPDPRAAGLQPCRDEAGVREALRQVDRRDVGRLGRGNRDRSVCGIG